MFPTGKPTGIPRSISNLNHQMKEQKIKQILFFPKMCLSLLLLMQKDTCSFFYIVLKSWLYGHGWYCWLMFCTVYTSLAVRKMFYWNHKVWELKLFVLIREECVKLVITGTLTIKDRPILLKNNNKMPNNHPVNFIYHTLWSLFLPGHLLFNI